MATQVYLCPLSTFMSCFNNSGLALTNGLIWTYVGGTVNTPATTWTDSTGTVPNSNPVQLTGGGAVYDCNVTSVGVTFAKNGGTSGFTAANNKGLIQHWHIVYSIL